MEHTTPSNELAIKLTNVSKFYKLYESSKYRLLEAFHPKRKAYHQKYQAIKNINLEVKKGEVLGIVGKNGSGKSTLLKLITGVLKPDEGEIKINGRISALLELGSGFNPQFTGMQNIFFYGTIMGLSKQEMRDKIDDILAFADIGEFIDQPIKTYSSGMNARLGFAVAVHIDPEILILDEVLAVGDVLFKRKCYAKMKEFFDGGKTIIYVSHDATSIKALCSRAIFLLDGDIIIDADPKTVTHFYEKYQFSPQKLQVSLKNEMRNFNSKSIDNEIQDDEQAEEIDELFGGDAYLPNFISTPSFGESTLVSFDNIALYNSKNDKVNVLQTNHTYRLSFTVNFNDNAEDIFFGAEILTLTGNIVSSVDTKRYKTDEVYPVKDGDIFEIDIEFDCLLLPGVYVINVFAINGDTGLTIHDAYIFKVKPTDWSQGGLVHLRQDIRVNKQKVD